MDSINFLYALLFVAIIVLLFYKEYLWAFISIVIYVAILIYHTTRLNSGFIKKTSGTDDDGEVLSEELFISPTSIIAGPVKNYQDNTWESNNLAVKATLLPNALDISGDADVSGVYISNRDISFS